MKIGVCKHTKRARAGAEQKEHVSDNYMEDLRTKSEEHDVCRKCMKEPIRGMCVCMRVLVLAFKKKRTTVIRRLILFGFCGQEGRTHVHSQYITTEDRGEQCFPCFRVGAEMGWMDGGHYNDACM